MFGTLFRVLFVCFVVVFPSQHCSTYRHGGKESRNSRNNTKSKLRKKDQLRLLRTFSSTRGAKDGNLRYTRSFYNDY